MTEVDVVVIGAGPAGLSTALNLVRAKRSVLVLDSNRPRNAATLRSHGFLTRDGISPLELRKLGREELEQYPEASFAQAVVETVTRTTDGGWRVEGTWRKKHTVKAMARAVVIATGLHEEFPALPSLRAFYGTTVHSCVECDAYEKAGMPLALIGETDDIVDRALLIAAWSDDLIVFTNGAVALSEADRARLTAAGIGLREEPLDDLEGDRDGLTGVRLQTGEVVPREAGFVRPIWHADHAYLDARVEQDAEGLIVVDRVGRTTEPGLYAVGDVTPPGPEQLIVAAGHGAMTAAAVHRDLVGGLSDVRDAVE
jgi:thioredoxin reductase